LDTEPRLIIGDKAELRVYPFAQVVDIARDQAIGLQAAAGDDAHAFVGREEGVAWQKDELDDC
jgi:hypothetical protein